MKKIIITCFLLIIFSIATFEAKITRLRSRRHARSLLRFTHQRKLKNIRHERKEKNIRHQRKEKHANKGIFANSHSYLATYDASEKVVSHYHVQGDGDTKQYFEKGQLIMQYKVDKRDVVPNIGEDFFKKQQDNSEFLIQRAIMLYRLSGTLPKDKVLKEMDTARQNPTSHTPSLFQAIYYFKWKATVDEKNEFRVFHALVELCVQNSKTQELSRILIDRGSLEAAKDPWATRVRFIYLGPAKDCSVDKTNLPQMYTEEPDNIIVSTKLPVNNVPFDSLIELAKQYVINFPVYNTLVNCQHFATNVFNTLTNSSEDYFSASTMKDHSDASGLQDNTSIKFGLTLPPSKPAALRNMVTKAEEHHGIRIQITYGSGGDDIYIDEDAHDNEQQNQARF